RHEGVAGEVAATAPGGSARGARRTEGLRVQLGQPDALVRAAPVPDGQGPAYRARGRQSGGGTGRRPGRFPGSGYPLAQEERSGRGVTLGLPGPARSDGCGLRVPLASPGDRCRSLRPARLTPRPLTARARLVGPRDRCVDLPTLL